MLHVPRYYFNQRWFFGGKSDLTKKSLFPKIPGINIPDSRGKNPQSLRIKSQDFKNSPFPEYQSPDFQKPPN